MKIIVLILGVVVITATDPFSEDEARRRCEKAVETLFLEINRSHPGPPNDSVKNLKQELKALVAGPLSEIKALLDLLDVTNLKNIFVGTSLNDNIVNAADTLKYEVIYFRALFLYLANKRNNLGDFRSKLMFPLFGSWYTQLKKVHPDLVEQKKAVRKTGWINMNKLWLPLTRSKKPLDIHLTKLDFAEKCLSPNAINIENLPSMLMTRSKELLDTIGDRYKMPGGTLERNDGILISKLAKCMIPMSDIQDDETLKEIVKRIHSVDV